MCGIVGMTGAHARDRDFQGPVDSLQHRGPDDGHFVLLNDSVFLGHRRLSVIDTSEAGRQPMSNEDGTLWITYNGEIYNFRELRNALQARGHRFRSKTDTEVVLHLYEEKGEACLNELVGMYAFAIYDSKRQRLFLARDRLGIKPLYYAFDKGRFAFSSEIKGLLALDVVSKKINWQAIYDYFSFHYVPHPFTAFQGIYQLPPAHALVFDLNGKSLEMDSYWSPWPGAGKNDASFEDLSEELRALLSDVVKGHLISDVSLGLFLSGGIDSSILACLMASNSPVPLKTFTVVFRGDGIKPHDDREHARRISRRLGTDHTEIEVEITSPMEVLDLLHYFDQPFANPTLYLSHLVSKMSREFITVALSGVGGDELFGGYPRYQALGYGKVLRHIPSSLARFPSALLRCIKEDPDKVWIRRLKLFARGMGTPLAEQYLRWTYFFSDAEKRQLLQPARRDSMRPSTALIHSYIDECPDEDLLSIAQFVDLKTFLVDNVLEYTDKTSMAVGLEVRVPFLDHRVVEYAFKLPAKYKIAKRETKKILKEAFKDMIPPENLRAPKRGFVPPLAVWFEKYFDHYFDQFMSKDYVRRQGVFHWDFLQAIRREHKARKRDNSNELFGIIMFDTWYRKFFGAGF
jgi:asparagine synthase (glutamine-hydrolysing)